MRELSLTRQRWRSVSNSIRKSQLVSLQDGKPLLSVFPHPKNDTFGLKSLMTVMDISCKDLNIQKEKLHETAANIASNWELILERILPPAEAKQVAHSLKEVFGIDENATKAFNTFRLLKKVPDIHGKKKDLINALREASKRRNENCLIKTNETDRSEEVLMSYAHMRVLERNSARILERLLPLKAVDLTGAIDALFKKDPVQKMSPTYHVLQRYMEYGFTSMDLLLKLLMDDKLIFSRENFVESGDFTEQVHPTVSFEVKFDTPGKRTEEEIKKNLTELLDEFKSNENAIIWMNQEYERVRRERHWEPIKVTKNDLQEVGISVENVWYGGELHEKVTVDFEYDKYPNCSEIPADEKKRLDQLKDFFRLVLENVYQLVPIEEEFVKNGNTWESNKKPEADGNVYETYEYRVRQMIQEMKNKDSKVLDETVSVFKSLGDKGMKYNEAQKILDLLNKDSDVDNLTIRVQKARKGSLVNVIHSGPIFVAPKMETRLNELPEEVLQEIDQLMVKNLLSKELKDNYAEVFDIIINVNLPSLFDVAERPDLGRRIEEFKSSPRNMVAIILNKFRDGNGTLGQLQNAFFAVKRDQAEKKYVRAMDALVKGIEDIAQNAKEQSDRRAKKLIAKDRSFKTFVDFLKANKPNGMKMYVKAKGFGQEQFLRLAADKQILPGDMIGFYRRSLGLTYAHAGIYAPINDSLKCVVHVQPQAGMFKGIGRQSEIRCDELKRVIKEGDRLFFMHECENIVAQAEVLNKVESCLFEEAIQYTYNGSYGSCQTFCSRILGSTLFEELNPEAFLASETVMKAIARWFLGGEANADELVQEMNQRFQTLPPASNLAQTDGKLAKSYPETSRLGRYMIKRLERERELERTLADNARMAGIGDYYIN